MLAISKNYSIEGVYSNLFTLKEVSMQSALNLQHMVMTAKVAAIIVVHLQHNFGVL